MDDVSAAAGGVTEILSCYDRLFESLALLGCDISLVKTKFQVPVGRASEDLLVSALNRGIEVVHGNVPALGGMIGCNDEEFENFLLNELASYDPLLKAIRDPALPAALALYYIRSCVLPKPVHLMRNLPIRITQGHMSAFDAKLRGAALSRLGLPSSIPDSAIFSFHQPIGTGGLGHAEAELACPAARWACLALAADEVQDLIESGMESALVLDRIETFNILRRAGVPLTDAAHDGCGPAADEWKLLPSSPALLHTHYLGLDGQTLPHLQKTLSVGAVA